MSMLDMNLNDAQEPTVVPAGEEYKIRILTVKVDNDKNNQPYMLPTFEVPDVAASKSFTKFLRIPNESLDAKKMNSAKWQIKLFLECFGMDPGRPFNPEELTGLTGWAILGIEEDEEYGDKNYVKKFIAPK